MLLQTHSCELIVTLESEKKVPKMTKKECCCRPKAASSQFNLQLTSSQQAIVGKQDQFCLLARQEWNWQDRSRRQNNGCSAAFAIWRLSHIVVHSVAMH